MASAMILFQMKGNWIATRVDVHEVTEKQDDNFSFVKMTMIGFQYLWSQSWGMLVLLKASASILAGAIDVLHVSISESSDFVDVNTTSLDSATRLGILFACIGVGALMGSLLLDRWDVKENASLQQASVGSIAVITVGFVGIGFSISSFWLICAFTILVTAGYGFNFVNSTLLIQKLTDPTMLGRVSSIDLALNLIAEVVSAMICGSLLQDHFRWSANTCALFISVVGVVLVIGWCIKSKTFQSHGRIALDAQPEVCCEDECIDAEMSPLATVKSKKRNNEVIV